MAGKEKELVMKILIIEDNQKHLVDAKAVVAEMRIEADFATTYVDAKNMMENNKYDGIVSDIFFPYAEKTSYSLNGWNFTARFECENMLDEIIHRIGRSDIKWIKAANKWISGQEMHPTGIMIARDCLVANVPVVLCTDTYHHGWSTEPVNIWAGKNEIKVFDGYPSENPYENCVATKCWKEAIKRLQLEIKHGLKGSALTEKLYEPREKGDE